MIKFTKLFENIEGRDYSIFKLIWNDSKGRHVKMGKWFQDHIIGVIAWADEHDLEVIGFNNGGLDPNSGIPMIVIELDSCGEDFEE